MSCYWIFLVQCVSGVAVTNGLTCVRLCWLCVLRVLVFAALVSDDPTAASRVVAEADIWPDAPLDPSEEADAATAAHHDGVVVLVGGGSSSGAGGGSSGTVDRSTLSLSRV